MPNFEAFIYWLCLGLMTASAMGMVAILKMIWGELKALNERMIVIIERVNYHEERISKLEERRQHGNAHN